MARCREAIASDEHAVSFGHSGTIAPPVSAHANFTYPPVHERAASKYWLTGPNVSPARRSAFLTKWPGAHYPLHVYRLGGANPPPYCDMSLIRSDTIGARFAIDYTSRRRSYDEEFGVPHGDGRPEVNSSPRRDRLNMLPAYSCQEWEQLYGLCDLQGIENHRDAWGPHRGDEPQLPWTNAGYTDSPLPTLLDGNIRFFNGTDWVVDTRPTTFDGKQWVIDNRTVTSARAIRPGPDEYIDGRPDTAGVGSNSAAPKMMAVQSPHGHMRAVLDGTVGSRTHPGQWMLNSQAARVPDAAPIAPFHHGGTFHHGPSAYEHVQDKLQLEAAAKAEDWDRPLKVGGIPADAQPLMVPDGGVRHAEALGVVYDSALDIHWIPGSASLKSVVRKMQTFAAARRSGILLRVPAPGSTGHTSAPPFGLEAAIVAAEESLADLASVSPAFSFVPPVSPPTGAKDLIPSQPVNPIADSRRTFDFPELSRALPVIPGTPVVAGPTRNTMAASAAAAFAVGAVAMASVVQFHDPGTPRPRSCHTAVQLALPASMLMLLLAACVATCLDKLTSIHARPQAERRRSRATRLSRGDTQPIHRNTNPDFSMFSSSRQIDFRW